MSPRNPSLLLLLLLSVAVLSPRTSMAEDAFSQNPLLKAVVAKDVAKVKEHLALGESANLAAEDGTTLLHVAAAGCSDEIVTLLLEAGAKVGAKSSEGATPLHFAAMKGCMDVVPMLIKAGAKVGAKAMNDLTPLHMAAQCWNEKAIKDLVAAGAAVGVITADGFTPLHLTAQNGFDDNAKALLDLGAKVDPVSPEGWTPLHIAIAQKKWDVVDVLLEAGADPGRKSQTGETPLHLILQADYERDRAKIMIGKLKDANLRTKSGITPLYIAAAKGEKELVSLLLEKGADPNITDLDGIPPLAVARHESNMSVVEILEAAGAKDAAPFFYIYNAALEGRVEKLRKALALPGAKDAVGETAKGGVGPLHAAANKDCEWCVIELLAAGWPLDAADANGNTALHMAAAVRAWDVCRILTAAGADPAQKNKEGGTATIFAEQLGEAGFFVKQALTPKVLEAAKAGNQGPIDAFLDGGGDPDAHEYRRSLMFHVLENGHLDLASHLRSRGASLSFSAPGGSPPIIGAVRGKNRLVLDWLVAQGASLTVTGRLEARPIHIAASTPWLEGLDVLLAAGADVNALAGSWGLTSLHYAALGGDLAVVKRLLEKGAAPDRNVKPQGTPMHLAAQEGKVEIVRALIEAGADVNVAVDEYGETPLHEAASGSCVVTDYLGPWHPVDEAAFCAGKPAVVKLLIEKGAKINPLTSYKATPLEVATDPEIIRILEAAGGTRKKKNK